MSKFDDVLKRIEEQMPNMQQQPAAGTQTNPANIAQQQKPALNPTQQQEVEKLADQLAKINDPNKIKEVLATIMQGVTHPQNGVGAQTKAV
jgi:BMFP domain-containing protein YqiC